MPNHHHPIVMSNLYKNRYRVPSSRLQQWDYRWQGHYFITICTKDRIPYFGEIDNKCINLSTIGKIVQEEWERSFELRPDMNLSMGEFIVMPNHFHAIVTIGFNQYNGNSHNDAINVETRCLASENEQHIPHTKDAKHCVSTGNTCPNVETRCLASTGNKSNKQNHFQAQSKNLASIIRGFKSAVTIKARQIDPSFRWQPRYHDHIIRDHQQYNVISQYIRTNVSKWDEDRYRC